MILSQKPPLQQCNHADMLNLLMHNIMDFHVKCYLAN